MQNIEFSAVAHLPLRTAVNTHWLDEICLLEFFQLFNQKTGIIVVCET